MKCLNDLNDLIKNVFKDMKFDKTYIKLCNNFSDFNNRENLKISDVKQLIKFFDKDYNYISRDRTFMKEFKLNEFSVRFFIGYKGGIADFSYLIWIEGENSNFYKERLASLSSSINPSFESQVKFKCPIATSLNDYKEILTIIFELDNELQYKLYELGN
jgi:hypothetical protein